jgi:hypothetical protein
MRRRHFLLSCPFCAAGTARAAAVPRPMPYAPEELRRRGARLARNMGAFFSEDLRAQLPEPWPARLANVRLTLPAGEEGELQPLYFSAYPAERLVMAPLRTLLFLDDLAGLWASLERRRCGHDAAQRYMAMLFLRAPVGPRPPGPLAAFGLDERIYDDAFVKDVGNKLFGSAVFFMLAHELGHLALDHRPGMLGLASQQQEREADAFALEACAAVRLAPLGLIMFFAAAAAIEGQQTTHPLSGSRVHALAMGLRQRPRSFVDLAERDPARAAQSITYVASQLEIVAEGLDRPGIRALMHRRAAATAWSELRTSCPA